MKAILIVSLLAALVAGHDFPSDFSSNENVDFDDFENFGADYAPYEAQDNFEHENFEQDNFEHENFEQENFEHENFEQENFEQENFEHEDFESEPAFDEEPVANDGGFDTIIDAAGTYDETDALIKTLRTLRDDLDANVKSLKAKIADAKKSSGSAAKFASNSKSNMESKYNTMKTKEQEADETMSAYREARTAYGQANSFLAKNKPQWESEEAEYSSDLEVVVAINKLVGKLRDYKLRSTVTGLLEKIKDAATTNRRLVRERHAEASKDVESKKNAKSSTYELAKVAKTAFNNAKSTYNSAKTTFDSASTGSSTAKKENDANIGTWEAEIDNLEKEIRSIASMITQVNDLGEGADAPSGSGSGSGSL